METPFSIKGAIKEGWRLTKAHSALVFQLVLTVFALQVLQALVSKSLEHTLIGLSAMIVLVALGILVGIGVTRITLLLAEGKHARYSDIIPKLNLAWSYILASLLSGIIIVGGLILLIIPGIYFALRFGMVRFAILEGVSVRESLRLSSRYTEGVKWRLLGFFILMGLINLLGLLALGVGLLVTIPVTALAYAHVYLKLKERAERATVTSASA